MVRQHANLVAVHGCDFLQVLQSGLESWLESQAVFLFVCLFFLVQVSFQFWPGRQAHVDWQFLKQTYSFHLPSLCLLSGGGWASVASCLLRCRVGFSKQERILAVALRSFPVPWTVVLTVGLGFLLRRSHSSSSSVLSRLLLPS